MFKRVCIPQAQAKLRAISCIPCKLTVLAATQVPLPAHMKSEQQLMVAQEAPETAHCNHKHTVTNAVSSLTMKGYANTAAAISVTRELVASYTPRQLHVGTHSSQQQRQTAHNVWQPCVSKQQVLGAQLQEHLP